MMHTYSVCSWDDAQRDYLLNPEHRYFVSVVDNFSKNRPLEFDCLPSAQKLRLFVDVDANNTNEVVNAITKLLEWHKAVPEGKHIVIHCSMGITRSPSLLLAMMIADGRSVKDAYEELDRLGDHFELSPRIIECIDDMMDLDFELASMYYDRRG